MTRVAFVAALLALAGCYSPPPGEPEPGKLRVEALLPTPLLDAPRAACTARAIREDATAQVPRQDAASRLDYAGLPHRMPNEQPSWATPEYQASYDAAVEAARDLTVQRAALDAAARVSAQPQSAADYAELALAHDRAFAAAAQGKDGRRRSAEKTLRRMAFSQPDLEALYQSEFQTRYRSGRCGAAATPHLAPAADAARAPLLPTPLLDGARATCAAAGLSERATAEWRFAYAREMGKPVDLPAGPPATGLAWTDWRAARDFAGLATLHTSAFALGSGNPDDGARRDAEKRLRRAAHQHPDLETLYQRAFDEAYRAGRCAAAPR